MIGKWPRWLPGMQSINTESFFNTNSELHQQGFSASTNTRILEELKQGHKSRTHEVFQS